ncbi:VOC family protein [Sphingomonas sp.]|uniref:VOC family protein n=1 Tax=Sphingomonas sp. TaxID=28214 RepID=UPI001EB843EF|nr:VOC family protein [Sphingomonas sp.]MBX3594335.1 hypothetical protein [Sphingomonas sp.]
MLRTRRAKRLRRKRGRGGAATGIPAPAAGWPDAEDRAVATAKSGCVKKCVIAMLADNKGFWSEIVELNLKRIILFSADVPRLARFYQDVIGLSVIGREDGWIEFDAGGSNIAIHAGPSKIGSRAPKLVFHSSDVATTRANLINRGFGGLGPIVSTATFDMCDGKDIDGNAIQISSRR